MGEDTHIHIHLNQGDAPVERRVTKRVKAATKRKASPSKKPKLSKYHRHMKREMKSLKAKHPRMKHQARFKKAAKAWKKKK